MIVDAGAEERDLVDRVPCRELLEMPRELGLRKRGCHGQLPPEADAGRDVAEQLVD